MYIRKRFYTDDCLKVSREQLEYRDNLSAKTKELDRKYNDFIQSIGINEFVFKEVLNEEEKAYFDKFRHYYKVFTYGEENQPKNAAIGIPRIPAELKDDNCNTWIGQEINIYEKGKEQEDNVEKIIGIYNTTFRNKYCFKDVVLYSSINDGQRTRETDNILLTDVGIFVLEVKSFDNLSITDDNKVLGKANTKGVNKAAEQSRKNTENLRALLDKNGIDIKIYPLAIVKGYKFSNTNAPKDTIATPEEIYDRYIEKKNSMSSDMLYNDKMLDKIKDIIEDSRLKKHLPPNYAYNSKLREYYITNNNNYPTFSKILLDDELEKEVELFYEYINNLFENTDLIDRLNKRLLAIQEEKDKEKEEKILESKRKQLEREERLKNEAKEKKKADRKDRTKIILAGIMALIIAFFIIWGIKFTACIACPVVFCGGDWNEWIDSYYK